MVAVSNLTLIKIASIGGIVTCSMGLLLHKTIKENIRHSDYYVEGFKALRTNRAAIKLLGEPIKEGNLDLSNKNNYYEHLKAHVEVPVKGPYQKGTLYLWAIRNSCYEDWLVQRIELGLKDEPDRRLLIRNVTD